MNIKQATDKLLKNWPVKLLCLVVAIFLYIFHEASLIEKKNFIVPLTLIEDGEVMHIGNCPNTITVSVKSLPSDMSEIHLNDFKATLDLSRIAESGTYDVPVQVELSEQLKAFDQMEIRTKPSVISVNAEKKIAKYIPLEASVSGDVAHGYKIESIDLNPSTVSVIGPESIVNKINKIYTDKIVVSNAEINFSTEVKYLEVNKMVKVHDKGPYKATVTVVPQEASKDFNDIPVVPVNLIPELEIEGAIPAVSLSVSGSMLFLEDYVPGKNSVQIDLAEITEPGEYELPVLVYVSSNAKIEAVSRDTVMVKVIEKVQVEEPQEN